MAIIITKCIYYYVHMFIYLFVVYLMVVTVTLIVQLRVVGQLVIDICVEKSVVSKCDFIPEAAR